MEHLKLRRDWIDCIYFSSFKSNGWGTAILLNKNIPFIIEKEEYDPESRYILVTGFIFGQHLTILNMYAPNEDCPKSRMALLFSQYCKGLGLLEGDFNCVLNASLAKSSSAPLANPNLPTLPGYWPNTKACEVMCNQERLALCEDKGSSSAAADSIIVVVRASAAAVSLRCN